MGVGYRDIRRWSRTGLCASAHRGNGPAEIRPSPISGVTNGVGVGAPAEAASHQLLKEQVEAVLDSLTGRERRVLQLRFGLEDGRARTLEEVGKEFNVTRERIRQIEAKALRKLRHPSRSKRLKSFMES